MHHLQRVAFAVSVINELHRLMCRMISLCFLRMLCRLYSAILAIDRNREIERNFPLNMRSLLQKHWAGFSKLSVIRKLVKCNILRDIGFFKTTSKLTGSVKHGGVGVLTTTISNVTELYSMVISPPKVYGIDSTPVLFDRFTTCRLSSLHNMKI